MMAADGALHEPNTSSTNYSKNLELESSVQQGTYRSQKEDNQDINESDNIMKSPDDDSKKEQNSIQLDEQDSSEDEEKLVIHENSEKLESKKIIVNESLPKKNAEKRKSEYQLLKVQKRKNDTGEPDSHTHEMEDVDAQIVKIKTEIQNFNVALQKKEEEWNELLILRKQKEISCLQLMRKKKVLSIIESDFTDATDIDLQCKSDLQVKSQNSSHSNVVDIHTVTSEQMLICPKISISAETQESLGQQLTSMKSLLSKGSTKSSSLLPARGPDSMGFGPQGPTVSVRQLIADHRKENPNLPPIRGAKRGAWKSRYEGERRDGGRISPSDNDPENAARKQSAFIDSLHASNDPNVSYKDILLQFAQMTQQGNGILPQTPQISIIPMVKSASTGKSEPMPESALPPTHLNTEGSSALAKLLLESQATSNGTSKSPGDRKEDAASPYLTLSALLSSKEPASSPKESLPIVESQNQDSSENRKKKTDGLNPDCQGCHKNRAQFVCAGCGNQWYCSRPCQVQAWDAHADKCHS